MPAILELPEVRARIVRFSVKDYDFLTESGAFEKQTELIRGVVIDKMSKSPLHSKLSERIFFLLLALGRAGLVIFTERPLRLADSVPEPDVMVVQGERSDFDDHHPTQAILVVEVAVSSAALDRENASLYAEASIPEYWIILALEKRVELYRQPQGGTYQENRFYSLGETLNCESVPGLQVSLAELFA